MHAHVLAIALLLGNGCAPATLGMTTSALVSSGGGGPDGDNCITQEHCGPSGGSGSVTIPLLIILAAVTVPAFLHVHVFRSDPTRPSATARSASAAAE